MCCEQVAAGCVSVAVTREWARGRRPSRIPLRIPLGFATAEWRRVYEAIEWTISSVLWRERLYGDGVVSERWIVAKTRKRRGKLDLFGIYCVFLTKTENVGRRRRLWRAARRSRTRPRQAARTWPCAAPRASRETRTTERTSTWTASCSRWTPPSNRHGSDLRFSFDGSELYRFRCVSDCGEFQRRARSAALQNTIDRHSPRHLFNQSHTPHVEF